MTPDHVLAAICDLAPGIAARAAEIETARRLPADLARTLAETGVFRLVVPRAIGGIEAPPTKYFEIVRRLAQADGSVGWCAMIGATSGLPAAYLPEAEAALIYGDPLTITGGVYAPTAKAVLESDSYRLTGRWKWASGSQNCRWLMGGTVVLQDGQPVLGPNGAPETRMLFFPAEQAILHDTWYSAGLCGTGSLDVEARDVLVPAARSVVLSTGRPARGGPLYAFPVFGLLALSIGAVGLGIARGALDDVRELSGVRVPMGSRRPMAERATVQAAYAEAEAQWRAASAFFDTAVVRAFAAAGDGSALDTAMRAELRLAATHATRTGAKVTEICWDLAGGSAVFRDGTLQRRFRDAHVATQHMMIAPATYELAGRALLGLPTDTTTL
jgi:alkylation response protein AidB-like acyl-CoA dehydrogenase